ncbi:MAG TPA: outer membrane lipoprotein chaperone LolA [Thermoanaerobaculia bacterium]
MRTLAPTLILTLALATGVQAAPTALDRAAAAVNGMEANFTHRFTAKGFKNAQVETGSVLFGSLPSMRWSYAKPEQKVFVFDGTNSWFYVPADRQVTVSRINEARKRELPFLLLGDPAARDKHFIVKQQTRNGAIVTTLQPRDKNATIRTVTVTIAPSTNLIQRIDYTDRDGNQTSFELSGYHRRPAAAGSFTFTPPSGVQVIRAD